eukprot:g25724.t1
MGCWCPGDLLLDDNQHCVQAVDCPCHIDGMKYWPGQLVKVHCEICRCYQGRLDACQPNPQCSGNGHPFGAYVGCVRWTVAGRFGLLGGSVSDHVECRVFNGHSEVPTIRNNKDRGTSAEGFTEKLEGVKLHRVKIVNSRVVPTPWGSVGDLDSVKSVSVSRNPVFIAPCTVHTQYSDVH